MSYTDETLANDAYEKLKAINPQAPPSLIPRLRTMIPAALIQLAETNSRSPELDLLRTIFTSVTAVNGIAPLNALVNAAEPLLIDSRMEVFLTGSSNPLEPVPDRATLLIEKSVEFGFYCIEGLNIHVREANKNYGAYNGAVTITGTRIPLSTSIPLQLEGQVLNILTGNLMPQGATNGNS